MAVVEYFELIKVPVLFHKMVGHEVLPPVDSSRLRKLLLQIVNCFAFTVWSILNTLLATHLIITLANSNFLLVYALAPVLGFGLVAYLKMLTLRSNKTALKEVLEQLEDIYPKTLLLQKDYQIQRFYKSLQPVMKLYASLCLGNTLYFTGLPFLKSIAESLFFGESFSYPLPLFIWYPFNPRRNLGIYLVIYSLESYGGVISAINYLTADLFLVSSLAQLCLHFDYISSSLGQFQPSSSEENQKFLCETIKHHAKCLELTTSVNNIFAFSLFCNFVGASLTICFVGFQVTSATVEELIQNVLLFVTSLAQVFIVCLYGNNLIYKSQAVGDAAFGHPWYMCDVSYRKMVVLIIARSQKFAAINAPIFPPISLQTFTKVLSMSYQFFAVIRTTSDN